MDILKLIFGISILLLISGRASAALIYTDRSLWEVDVLALNGQIMTDTFSNTIANADMITLDSGIVSSTNPGLLEQGLNFIRPDTDPLYVGRPGSDINHPSTITWQFPASTLGFFGDDFRGIAPDGELTITGNFPVSRLSRGDAG